jgi:muramoyltetrapeptide carboxypeptidase
LGKSFRPREILPSRHLFPERWRRLSWEDAFPHLRPHGNPLGDRHAGKILIIEDVGEQPYKYDRWLCQLRSSGKLQQCAGVVVGQCIDCTADKPKMDLPLEEIFADLLVPLGVPVLLNVPFGHGKRKATFPLGVRALLDGNAGRFFLTESGVR